MLKLWWGWALLVILVCAVLLPFFTAVGTNIMSFH
jgi:hypothetical protein